MPRGVVTHRMPCSFQTHGCNHILLRRKNARKPWHLSCKATGDRVDRRDLLLGGAVTAVAGLAADHRGNALAAPIQPPDLRNCHPVHPAHLDNTCPPINCCPPFKTGTKIIDFTPPSAGSPLRVRRPAHYMDDTEYLKKYKEAVKLMKALPHDDPRSFEQQWRVHCAYCEGAYNQVGYPDQEIQIHHCWLFFPWHRLYLYFHERILGKLIGDDTFALPFWNWDAPGGMHLPSIYADQSSPLYDEKRDPRHAQPPFPLVDLDYNHKPYTQATIDRNYSDDLRGQEPTVEKNLKIMYRQMISGAKKKELFFGGCYGQGDCDSENRAGTIECQPHNLVHDWTGDSCHHGGEDMGHLYSAARDPLFFAHHGNVDRMWYIWTHELSPSNTNFTKTDWLDASFLFYDEEKRLVRVRVRDSLDITAMRYKYQDVPIPWRDAKPLVAGGAQPPPPPPGSSGTALPATLGDKPLRVWVLVPRRPPMEGEEVVLVLKDIEIADHSRYIKFDVFVNNPEGLADTATAHCAGSVVLLPHAIRAGKDKDSMKTTAWFGIGDLLDAIGANKEDKGVYVSIVPRSAGDVVTVGSVRIEYVK